jgi:hypothetical protein
VVDTTSAIARALRESSGSSLDILSLLRSSELVLDLGLLDERVEDVEDRVAGPDLSRLGEDKLFLLGLARDLVAPKGERGVLVDKLVDAVERAESAREREREADDGNEHVVEPVDGEGERDGTGRVEDQVEELAVVLVRSDPVVNVGLETGVDCGWGGSAQ